jgi:hypothetical protein
MLDTFDQQRLMDYEPHVKEQRDGRDREDHDLNGQVLKDEAQHG